MRAYQKPTFVTGPRLQAVTAQFCVSPFFAECFVEEVVPEPPPPPPPAT